MKDKFSDTSKTITETEFRKMVSELVKELKKQGTPDDIIVEALIEMPERENQMAIPHFSNI